uniref:C2H2-type domain-containing protein n=1 Tax=Anopheles stephensi TaxID=30069 RepID=A0A182YC77_ANOST
MTDQTQTATDPRRIYLTPEEILAEKIYICSFENCFAMLHNLANLQMHLTRHHKAPAINLQSLNGAAKSERTHFYCPHESCPYYQTSEERTNGARYFGSLRSLKQHYLKVHGERKHRCEACEKSFATESYLRHHRLSCGQKFSCDHCSYTYGSREALLTHAKRKRHGYEELLSAKKPHRVKPAKQVAEVKCVSTATQTLSERSESKTTQTITSNTVAVETREAEIRLPVETVATLVQTCTFPEPIVHGTEPLAPVVCTETQTDFIDVMFAHTENRHDPLLSYAHMYTQTSDEPGLLADLGLSTTETQTSWNEESETFGDYLVSTETQTNFDIDSFDCSSNSIGDKADPVNSKHTQVPEAMADEFHLLRGASSFLSDIADTIDDHRAVHTQTS